MAPTSFAANKSIVWPSSQVGYDVRLVARRHRFAELHPIFWDRRCRAPQQPGTLGRDQTIGLLAARITSEMKTATSSEIGASYLLAGDAVAVPI